MELVLEDAQSALTTSEITFGRDFNEALAHQAVVAYAAGTRQGTRAQKIRVEITGSGKKPRRRKSTGHARSGSIKSLIWRSGGMTFAARPQNHSQKANKKMYYGMLEGILSEPIRQDRLIVVEPSSVEAPGTKLLVQKLEDMALENVPIITGELGENPLLAACNSYKADVCDTAGIDPVGLITFDKVVMTTDTVKQVEETLA